MKRNPSVVTALAALLHTSFFAFAQPMDLQASVNSTHYYATTSYVRPTHIVARPDPFHAHSQSYGIMNVHKIGQRHEWTYEVEVPIDLEVHKIHPIDDNPDNLHRVLNKSYREDPARYTTEADRQIQSAMALRWMNKGYFDKVPMHNRRRNRKGYAVYLQYASTDKKAVIAYSKVEQNKRDKYMHREQDLRNQGLVKHAMSEGNRIYYQDKFQRDYANKKIVPYHGNRIDRGNLDGLDSDLKIDSLDDEAHQFNRIFYHYMNGDLQHLTHSADTGFHLIQR